MIDEITQKINTNYYLMYIQNFIDAFDMDKSKYKYVEKYDCYIFIPKYTFLNRKICSNYDIFRCIKSKSAIYVSSKFYDIIKENNFSGFAFYEQL